MTDRCSPLVVAVHAGSSTATAYVPRLPGLPAGMRLKRSGPRRFQLVLSAGPVTPPWIITVAVKNKRVRFLDGIGPSTPDRVRAAAETGAQLLWEHYGRPELEHLPVPSPVRAVCRRTEADGTVVHRVRVATAALAGHHVAEISSCGTITFPTGRQVPDIVRRAVEDVAARLAQTCVAPELPAAA